jgi:hypothetical protein
MVKAGHPSSDWEETDPDALILSREKMPGSKQNEYVQIWRWRKRDFLKRFCAKLI